MRGVFFVVVLIALLIVGALVIKNMKSGTTSEGVNKQQAIEHAKKTAQEAEKAIGKLNKTLQQLPQK